METVAFALALIVGKVLKLKLSEQRLRDIIPVFVFASQFLGRLVLEVTEAQAGIFGVFGKVGPGLEQLAMQSLMVTILASGAQSTTKNVAKAFGVNSLALLRAKAIVAMGGKLPE